MKLDHPLLRSKKFLVGIGILLFFIALATVMSWFLPDPKATIDSPWRTPSNQRILGTDLFGRDVFSLFVHGINKSIRIGVLAGITATSLGVIIGSVADHKGGLLDEILVIITNIMLVIATLALLIVS